MLNTRFQNVQLLDADAPENQVMREAVAIARAAASSDGLHRFALRDLHSAQREPSADAFFYAYRAVEAVRQSIAPGEGTASEWNKMHEALGTTKKQIDPLTTIATQVRHGEAAARQAAPTTERDSRIEIARDVVFAEFARLLNRDLLELVDR